MASVQPVGRQKVFLFPRPLFLSKKPQRPPAETLALRLYPSPAISGLRHRLSRQRSDEALAQQYNPNEVQVILINLGAEDFVIRRGERIAQMVVAPVAQAAWSEVDSLDETARGAGGFGSTGR